MAVSLATSLLEAINSPLPDSSQLAALKLLKNEIIGHDQKKEAWVLEGIIPALVWCISPDRRDKWSAVLKTLQHEHDGSETGGASLVDNDEIRFQATIILGSIAQGTPSNAQGPTTAD
jgi:hypothetical protein